MTRSEAARIAFGSCFILAGTLHLIVPDYYMAIMPSYLPAPAALVALSGLAEIIGGIGFLIPRFRRVAGVGLILLLIAVFPANLEMLRLAQVGDAPRWEKALLWLRLPLQAVLIWLAWRLSRPLQPPRAA